ncbi:MAG: monovalent cation/H(+) antiporter subunit G [Actinomycetes bacterium]
MSAVVADVLVVIGLAVMTLGVFGIVRFPDVYTQLHASGKAAFLGVSVLLVAAAIGGGADIVSRVILAIVLLALTTPVAAHAIAQAAHQRREPMRSPGAVDESGTTPGATAPPPAEDSGFEPPTRW